jgi:putative flavoprotein involved in K+ transport
MSHLYDTIVIGAGQAGLASAYYLQRAGSRFLILDGASHIGESWRRRWDSLRLFTPVRYNSLPGLPFPGEPYALPVKDDVARYLEAYVAHFSLPVRLNMRVSSLVRDADQFVVATDGETFTSRSVIVATGAYHRAYIPAFASALSPILVQRHSSEYRNPAALPPGGVLVVGAGNSGAQIALELAESGHPTWLSGRDTGSIPRRVLGRDVYDWLSWTVMRPSVNSWLGRRLMGGQLFAGDPLVGFSRRALMIPMLTTVGRTVGVSNGHPQLDDGRVLEDVRTVVWCTGFRPDFRWIQLPVFRPDGYPDHRRGIVTAAPGLGFVGLRYQYRIGSSLLGGVHEDAEYVVRQLASHDHGGRNADHETRRHSGLRAPH